MRPFLAKIPLKYLESIMISRQNVFEISGYTVDIPIVLCYDKCSKVSVIIGVICGSAFAGAVGAERRGLRRRPGLAQTRDPKRTPGFGGAEGAWT